MDKIDKYLEQLVSQELEEPESYKRAVANALKSPKARIRIYKYRVLRVLSVICTVSIMIGGTAFAGVIAYKKIWQEPKEYSYQELQETLANTDIIEKKDELLTEEEAKKKAQEILESLGYKNKEIVNIELKKDVNQENAEYYSIKTDKNEKKGCDISINARTGELNSFTDKEIAYKDITIDNISEDIAKKYANQILVDSKYKKDDYKFANCEEIDYMYEKEPIDMWNATYYKMYDDIYNPYESVNINFLISNGNLEIESIIKTNNGKYAENPIEITEEEAINVAIEKEKEFTDNEISNVSVELGIRKMNEYIYNLENNISFLDNDNNNHLIEKIEKNEARKVFIVSIIHNQNINEKNEEEVLRGANKQYYIDCTTKEILGGQELIIKK